ncbi:hypothetical protein WDV90_13785 [Xanthomonas translucens pv. undulosa]
MPRKVFFSLRTGSRTRAWMSPAPRTAARETAGRVGVLQKKHGNYRCFCLRRSFAAGFAMAVVEVQQLPIAAIGALAARDA